MLFKIHQHEITFMKIYKSNTFKIISISIVIILGLDLVLYIVERANSQSVITTYSDALLYSFATVTKFKTTNILPTTSTGRVIGITYKTMNVGLYLLTINAGIELARR